MNNNCHCHCNCQTVKPEPDYIMKYESTRNGKSGSNSIKRIVTRDEIAGMSDDEAFEYAMKEIDKAKVILKELSEI